MYKIRVTATVEQIDFDGRVLFSMTDSVDESSVDDTENRVDVTAAFHRAMTDLRGQMKPVLGARYDSPKAGAGGEPAASPA